MEQPPTSTTVPATDDLLCQYGGVHCPPAEIFDIDGRWCTYECQSLDRVSEYSLLRRWAA